jgi:uncharacterized DUF497 family protein
LSLFFLTVLIGVGFGSDDAEAGAELRVGRAKNLANVEKHGVDFVEAQYAFLNPGRIILADLDHSGDEQRFFRIGKIEDRVMTVRFAWRAGRIRSSTRAGDAREEKSMSSGRPDETDDLGELDMLGPAVTDFLPLPDQLILREDSVKVTLSLSRRSVEFLKREAAKRHVPCQRMIRAPVDEPHAPLPVADRAGALFRSRPQFSSTRSSRIQPRVAPSPTWIHASCCSSTS